MACKNYSNFLGPSWKKLNIMVKIWYLYSCKVYKKCFVSPTLSFLDLLNKKPVLQKIESFIAFDNSFSSYSDFKEIYLFLHIEF